MIKLKNVKTIQELKKFALQDDFMDSVFFNGSAFSSKFLLHWSNFELRNEGTAGIFIESSKNWYSQKVKINSRYTVRGINQFGQDFLISEFQQFRTLKEAKEFLKNN